MTDATDRPHWLPEDVWLGVEIGKWPIHAFPDEASASRWAAAGKADTPTTIGDRRRIFRIPIPADVETFEAETIPTATRLKAAR